MTVQPKTLDSDGGLLSIALLATGLVETAIERGDNSDASTAFMIRKIAEELFFDDICELDDESSDIFVLLSNAAADRCRQASHNGDELAGLLANKWDQLMATPGK